jgi:hypothetical protein
MLHLIAARGDLELSAQARSQMRLDPSQPDDEGCIVFVNYRQTDTTRVAELVTQALVDRFGQRMVFLDRQAIDIGEVFTASIDFALRTARVLLALIGPAWATTTDRNGRRRLDDPGDHVRIEIERASQLGLAIVPVLVGLAELPRFRELPDSLSVLTRQRPILLAAAPARDQLAEMVSRVAELALRAAGSQDR